MKLSLLIIGFLFLFGFEILRVYFIMPFPGSQHYNSISVAYWLNQNMAMLRLFAFIILLVPLISIFKSKNKRAVIACSTLLLAYAAVFFFFNFRFQADKMFYQPTHKSFAGIKTNRVNTDKLVIGVEINGEAKAYPIQLIGYHHQVRDTIGHTPVLITYCTVCRTGRVFSPVIDGNNESFRLVGMDHFNAMFEDATTKSWWQQATGTAVAGKLKGKKLAEIPSHQSALKAWLRQFPNSYILQPDLIFKNEYKDLADFDKGTIKSGLEKRDKGSWKFKSWVVGIKYSTFSRAYDWNELVKKKLIQDSLFDLPLMIVLESDSVSFHAFDRRVNGKIISFEKPGRDDLLYDRETHSVWNMEGSCLTGPLKGQKLKQLQAYQEFWHSWQTFNPNTSKYK